MNLIYQQTDHYGDTAFSYHYCTSLSMAEQVDFITVVTSLVVSDAGYIPLLRDYAFHYAMLKFFTDIDLKQFLNDKGSFDIDAMESFIKHTSMIHTLKEQIDKGLLKTLNNSVDDNLAFTTGINKDNLSRVITQLINSMEAFVKNIHEHTDGADLSAIVDSLQDHKASAQQAATTN